METIRVKITDIKNNPNNPRIIKDDKFKKLVQSIKDFPKMLEIRPIVVNSDMIVLGGNMRLKASKEAGIKEVSIIIADNLTEDEQRQFIIKDNVAGGEWDWDMLANEWNSEELSDWGLDVWKPSEEINLDDFFEENLGEDKENVNKIILEYSDDDFVLINEAFGKHSGSKEQVVFNLLGL